MTRWLRLLGIAFALALLVGACGGDDGGGDDAADNAEAGEDAACDGDVCLAGTLFEPAGLTVAVGDTVTWASVDSPDHTVTADDDSFDSGTVSNGDTFEQSFDEAGEFAYHCEIHPSMTGTITVE